MCSDDLKEDFALSKTTRRSIEARVEQDIRNTKYEVAVRDKALELMAAIAHSDGKTASLFSEGELIEAVMAHARSLIPISRMTDDSSP